MTHSILIPFGWQRERGTLLHQTGVVDTVGQSHTHTHTHLCQCVFVMWWARIICIRICCAHHAKCVCVHRKHARVQSISGMEQRDSERITRETMQRREGGRALSGRFEILECACTLTREGESVFWGPSTSLGQRTRSPMESWACRTLVPCNDAGREQPPRPSEWRDDLNMIINLLHFQFYSQSCLCLSAYAFRETTRVKAQNESIYNNKKSIYVNHRQTSIGLAGLYNHTHTGRLWHNKHTRVMLSL